MRGARKLWHVLRILKTFCSFEYNLIVLGKSPPEYSHVLALLTKFYEFSSYAFDQICLKLIDLITSKSLKMIARTLAAVSFLSLTGILQIKFICTISILP